MNKLVLFTNVIFGILLLFSYYFIGKQNINKVEQLWGNIKNLERKMTIFSMILTGLLYLFVLNYLVFHTSNINQSKITNIVKYQAILILTSMLWMPLSIQYLNEKKFITKIAIILILFVVSMCALAVFYNIYKLNDKSKFKTMALIGSFMLFFHTFFLDFLNWNYNFF
jgi:cytochrome bd-type quinol oxidase subunit 2